MRQGFSLVELSIVLVILGLLTGGIPAGQSLIRAAELRSITTDAQRYTAAIHSFRDKYMAVPGDMANATRFWGVLAGTGADTTCRSTPSTTTATCNGDGDGKVTAGQGGTSYDNSERFRAWQHLANAGMVEGIYTGVSGDNTDTGLRRVPGSNIPKSRLEKSTGYDFTYRKTPVSTTSEFSVDAAMLYFSKATTSSNTYIPIISADEAWNIDVKGDDGKPGTGMILSGENNTGNADCVDSDVAASAAYVVSKTGQNCFLRFIVWR